MDKVGLKFLLSDGLFFVAIMPEERAQLLIREWGESKLSSKVYGVESLANGGSWAVNTDSIHGMHTVDLQLLQQGMAQVPMQNAPKPIANPWPGTK